MVIEPPGDTDPLSCEGDYCPSARLSGLEIPSDAANATMRGCRLEGNGNGSSLGGLLAIAGDVDTNSFVQPDENGDIQLILLNSLQGWETGATGNEAGTLDAQFYTGDQSGDNEFTISPSSFLESGEPLIRFETTIVDGLLATEASDFSVAIPIVEGLPLSLLLSQTQITGAVSVDEVGFAITDGVLGGYLTREAVIALIEGITTACNSPDGPADICGVVGTFLTGNAEADLGLLLSFIPGGFDTIINGDDVSACPDGGSPDCNAISVCILLEMKSTTITGISEE